MRMPFNNQPASWLPTDRPGYREVRLSTNARISSYRELSLVENKKNLNLCIFVHTQTYLCLLWLQQPAIKIEQTTASGRIAALYAYLISSQKCISLFLFNFIFILPCIYVYIYILSLSLSLSLSHFLSFYLFFFLCVSLSLFLSAQIYLCLPVISNNILTLSSQIAVLYGSSVLASSVLEICTREIKKILHKILQFSVF